MAAKKNAPEADSFLAAAARTVGHAAGEAAKAFGIDSAEGAAPALAPQRSTPAPKTPKRVSARGKRGARAGNLKDSAAALGKDASFDDVRYRRIMGKPASNWSDKDIDYIAGLVNSKHEASPAS